MEDSKNNKFLDKLIDKSLFIFHHIFNFVIIILTIAIIGAIGIKLYSLFTKSIAVANVRFIIDDVLFVLILVELFIILTIYLKKRSINVQRVVEVGMISIIREVIFVIFEVEPLKILSISGLLLVFGVIFFIEQWFSKDRD